MSWQYNLKSVFPSENKSIQSECSSTQFNILLLLTHLALKDNSAVYSLFVIAYLSCCWKVYKNDVLVKLIIV
jgi:hypothetical protein